MIRRSWMTGISIETTLELWASSLRAVKARMAPLFTQERVAASAGLFLGGLLGDERRKTGWMRAEAAGDTGPWGAQAIFRGQLQRGIPVPGASRPFWVEDGGTLTRCATSCANMRWRPWPIRMRFLFWMRPGFSSRARPPVASLVNTRGSAGKRSEEHTSELQSLRHLVCRLLLEK